MSESEARELVLGFVGDVGEEHLSLEDKLSQWREALQYLPDDERQILLETLVPDLQAPHDRAAA